MQPMIRDTLGTVLTQVYSQASGETTAETFLTTAHQKIVACQGLTHGNFHTPNPWSYTVSEVFFGDGFDKTTYDDPVDGYAITKTGPFVDISIVLPDASEFLGIADNNAISELYSKARENVNVAPDLVQAGQTKKLVTDARGFARKANSRLRRKKQSRTIKMEKERKALLRKLDRLCNEVTSLAKHAPGVLRKGGTAWLTWVYGISPTLSNIHGVAETLIRVRMNEIKRSKGRGRVLEEETETYTEDLHGVPVTVIVEKRVEAVVTYIADYSFRGYQLDDFMSNDPGSIVWELIPGSFLLDWFLNVGQYLESLENASKMSGNFQGGYCSTILSSRIKYSYSGQLSVGTYVRTIKGSGSQSTLSFSRRVLENSPAPSLRKARANLGSTRLLTTASLLSQFL